MHELFSLLHAWLLAVLSWLPVGLYVLHVFKVDRRDRPIIDFILSMLAGAAVNASILATLSLFMLLTVKVAWIVAAVTALPFIPRFMQGLFKVVYRIKYWSVLSWLGFAAFLYIVIRTSLLPTLNNDSGLYYIQFMEWINNYAVVPGLANLHDRFGFNSNWHLLSAAFQTNDLNALLFVLMGLGGFEAANSMITRRNMDFAVWVLLPLTFFLLLRFLTSTAPDLPATLIPMVYLTYLVAERKKSSLPLLVLLIAFACTVKLLSVLHIIAILPVVAWTLARKDYRALALAVGAGLVVTVPWLTRNVIQTGYLVFPMESIDLFHFDWKVPQELAANARKMVDTHARFGSYDLSNYGKPMAEWFPVWIGVQSKTVLAFLGIAGINSVLMLLVSLFQLSKKKHTDQATINLFVSLTVLFSFVFWWMSGPNPRFIYGISLFFFAYSLGALAVTFGMGKMLRMLPLLSLIPLIWMFRVVKHEPEPKRPTDFSTMQAVDGTIFYPLGTDKCWDYELPCSNMDRTDLEFRGESLASGFRNRE
jgi:hypothetical protein